MDYAVQRQVRDVGYLVMGPELKDGNYSVIDDSIRTTLGELGVQDGRYSKGQLRRLLPDQVTLKRNYDRPTRERLLGFIDQAALQMHRNGIDYVTLVGIRPQA